MWRECLETSLSECLIGHWYYFLFKSQSQHSKPNTNNLNAIYSSSTMATSMRLADSFEYDAKYNNQFLSIYDCLKLNQDEQKQKLNYSNSSFSFEIDASSIVDETFNENDFETCSNLNVSTQRLLLDLEKLQLK